MISPITPPEEVVQQWRHQWKCAPQDCMPDLQHYITTQAAQWGADQELDACCEVLNKSPYGASLAVNGVIEQLRAARRPKPLSLKEQALAALNVIEDKMLGPTTEEILIRKALEALPND